MSSQVFDNLDALRKPIEIGKMYGYSSSSSGTSKVVIGIAEKITDMGGVTLRIVKVTNFLYGKEIPPSENFTKNRTKRVNARSHILFPILDENIL